MLMSEPSIKYLSRLIGWLIDWSYLPAPLENSCPQTEDCDSLLWLKHIYFAYHSFYYTESRSSDHWRKKVQTLTTASAKHVKYLFIIFYVLIAQLAHVASAFIWFRVFLLNGLICSDESSLVSVYVFIYFNNFPSVGRGLVIHSLNRDGFCEQF